MKFLALVQARCGSSRLPDKVLLDLAGKMLAERVIERTRLSRFVDEVILTTSINKENLPLISLCSGKGIRVFAGSEDDVLDRFYQAAKLIQPEYVVRITADCPFYDAQILDSAIEALQKNVDYLTDLDCTLADGLDIEIVKFSALRTAWEKATLQSEREHVTLYIKNNKDKFKIQNFNSPFDNIGNKRWTIDEPRDYEFARKVYEHFADIKESFFTGDILSFLQQNKELEQLNSNIIRNEGLLKSLEADKGNNK